MDEEARLKKISIIMPVLNEAALLGETLVALRLTGSEELVVVDGGSTDGTVSVAREFTPKVLECQRGRARQMNHGARHAEGEILFFLHADCLLPEGAFGMVRKALHGTGVMAGAFDLRINHPGTRFRVVEWGANFRSRLTRVPYGDQGLFMMAETFRLMGGFGDIPLMEDIEMGRRLRSRGRVVFLRPPILASPRRWLNEGVLHTTLRDWALALSYTVLNVPAHKLARRYRDIR